MSEPAKPNGTQQSQATPQSQAAPKPAPKPGPRPGPRPGQKVSTQRPAPKPAGSAKSASGAPKPEAAAPQVPHNDPTKFGRVDADGTAWVTTPDGDRAIGQYQAGSPEEGLAHFGARYDDVSTQVAVLAARLVTHPEEAQRIREDAQRIIADLPTAAIIGDIPALQQRAEEVVANSHQAERQAEQDKADRKAAATQRKQELAAEAENIGESSTEWKKSGDRLRAMMNEWRGIKGVDKATDDELYARFAAGRDAFNRRREEHFDQLDKNRVSARIKKEALIEKAEAMQHSTDWGPTARAYRDLMDQWKAAGRAHRDVDDELWARFRAAQDVFFNARKADSAKRDEEFEANAEAKQKLIDEYRDQVDPQAHGLDKARNALHELQDKWEAIGYVPRDRVREFEDKIGELEDRVSEAADEQWKRTDPEAQARVAQFQAKVDQFTAEAEAAEAQGKTEKAKKLRDQAAQWKEWADAAAQAVEG